MRAVLCLFVGDDRQRRILAHLAGVAHDPPHADHPADRQQRHAEHDSVGERDPGGVGGDHRGEWVNGRSERADPRAEQYRGGGDHRIEAGCEHHRDEQRVERQRLFGHTVDGPARGEQRHQDRDHPLFAAPQAGGDAFDPGVNRPGFGDDPQKATDDQNKQRHVDRARLARFRIVQPGNRGHQHRDDPLRMRGDVCVSSGNGHFFAERGVHRHLVLPGRNNPAQGGDHGDQEKENGVSGRKFELAHDVLHAPAQPVAAPGGD
ncbi:hypothetical protein D3C72_875210 [compost metagenome]